MMAALRFEPGLHGYQPFAAFARVLALRSGQQKAPIKIKAKGGFR
jgi:hypothetical protein